MYRFLLINFLWLLFLSCTKEKAIDNGFKDEVFDVVDGPFKSYGLVGDGKTDETQALQKLINDSTNIYLKAGKYLISETITMPSGRKFIGEEGTMLIASTEMKGTLLQNGRFLSVTEGNNVLIKNIRFQQSARQFAFSEWNNACIFILNSKSITVEGCFFDFDLPYSTRGMEAVWVSGPYAAHNVIKQNIIKTLGIKYAENGADSTLVEQNVITKAYSNAITANGNNPTDEIDGCKVIKNRVENAGRMGIEDWGNTNGTVIEGNEITGTGIDPAQAHEGIGISAVGVRVNVIKNSITNSQLYAIEVRGNYGANVAHNTLTKNPAATGIILNYTFYAPKPNLAAATVNKNVIDDCEKGVHIFGDQQAEVFITENGFNDILTKAISLESGAEIYRIDILNNKFLFKNKADNERYAFFSYTKYQPGVARQIVYASDNNIEYAETAAGGKGIDFGFVIRTDHATINNLVLQGNNNRNAAHVPVLAISGLGAKPEQCTITNNKIYGAEVELNGFTNIVQKDNLVVK